MPPTAASLRVGRYFLSLFLILVVLYGLVFLPGQAATPKLGLDLEGGRQVIFKAKTDTGKAPSSSSMKVARDILFDRVNGAGVSSAEVVIEGNDRIVVSVPGKADNKLDGIGAAAQLNFRPAILPPATGASTTTPSTGATTSGAVVSGSATTTVTPTTSANTTTTPAATKASTSAAGANNLLAPQATGAATTSAKATTTPKATTTAKASVTPSPSATAAVAASEVADPFSCVGAPATARCVPLGFALPTSDTAFNAMTSAQQTAIYTALGKFKCGSKPTDVATKPLAACDSTGLKYLLGPVIVSGKQVKTASAVAPSGTGSLQWTVSMTLTGSGQTAWSKWTAAHNTNSSTTATITSCGPADTTGTSTAATFPCSDWVAFTLDGDAITVPATNSTINGDTSITGNFTEKSANTLANQLKFGALPLTFTQETAQDVSPTLGTSQLKAGLLAGGIGLVLVVLYSLLYYRGLGLVTVASLLVSGALTYACLVILGREINFTLTLSGIAGFIVAIGITADSFVVFFERLKDEVHEGRSIRVAVPRAWVRARRTIWSADAVSFLAAAVLYYLTSGEVRGFAFTLGLSTVLDLVVVYLFTHPIVSLLSRSKAFGSPRFTGLNSLRVAGTAIPDDDAPRPAGKVSTIKSARPAGGVALLEPEVEIETARSSGISLDDVAGAVTSRLAETESPSRASGRSRVTKAAAPAAIGLDAAERAAARRGRTVRPPKEEVVEEIDDDVDDFDDVVDPSPGAQDAVLNRATGDDATDDDATDDDATDDDATDDETASASARSRATARRSRLRRGRKAEPIIEESVADEPEVEELEVEADLDDQAHDEAVVVPDEQPEAVEEPVEPVAKTPRASARARDETLSPAAARAAARRARIRAKSEQEDES